MIFNPWNESTQRNLALVEAVRCAYVYHRFYRMLAKIAILFIVVTDRLTKSGIIVCRQCQVVSSAISSMCFVMKSLMYSGTFIPFFSAAFTNIS